MSVPVLAFFNNKGGVGKTSLVYHLAWMYAQSGTRLIAADLDPQANLSSAFLPEERLEQLWLEESRTIYSSVMPIVKGIGDISDPHVEQVADDLGLVVGDLSLSSFEDELSTHWPSCLDRKESAFRVISAFWRILQRAASSFAAEVVLLDLGPNLGAINRAALIAADRVVVPMAPDLFSLQGLRNLGPRLKQWRLDWSDRLKRNPEPKLILPPGNMLPVGYILMQHSVRLDRPVKAYERWMQRIPHIYQEFVLEEESREIPSVADDPHCLAMLKHYHSLMPMAQEARKPMFALKPADGAIGSHFHAVGQVRQDFMTLSKRLWGVAIEPFAS